MAYLVTGQATDYLITFPLPLLVPVWWSAFPEPPRLDVDLGLVLKGDAPVEVPGATRIAISHPDRHRVVFTLMDDSGSVIEGFEEIEFRRAGGAFGRPQDSQRSFYCLIPHPWPSIVIGVGLMISRGYRYPESGDLLDVCHARALAGRQSCGANACIHATGLLLRRSAMAPLRERIFIRGAAVGNPGTHPSR